MGGVGSGREMGDEEIRLGIGGGGGGKFSEHLWREGGSRGNRRL